MASEFCFERVVEFVDTDMAGIMHFSNFFRFMEAAEHAFFQSLGHSLHTQSADGMLGWARVDVSCNYRRPAKYQDRLVVRLRLREKSRRSLTYHVDFFRHDEQEMDPLAQGQMKVVCVRKAPGEANIRAAEIPAELDAKLEVAAATETE